MEIIDERTTQNIKHNLYEQKRFTKAFTGNDLAGELASGLGDYPQYPELVEDLFYSAFQYSPEFEDLLNVRHDYHNNRIFEDKAMKSGAWDQLRPYTKMDMGASAMGAMILGRTILEENKDAFQEMKKKQQQMNKSRNNIQELKKELQELQLANNQAPQSPSQQAKHQQQAQQIQQKIQQNLNEFREAKTQQQAIANEITVNIPTQKASETIKEIESFFGLGIGSEEGMPTKTDIEQRLKFAKLFTQNEQFKKLLIQVGKMQRLASKKQKEKTKRAMDQIDDVVPSNDLPHMVSSESLLLTDPMLETLFLKKFTESQLLTYKFSGQIEKVKGPIIACLDISGSMGGDPDVLSKAIALALVMIAHMQKRDAHILLFDTSVRREFAFPKDEPYFDKMEDMASFFTGGGTDFTPPLKRAMALFTSQNKALEKGDLVFITDGQGNIAKPTENKFQDLKKERKISVYSIIIDSSCEFIQHELKAISDNLVAIKEITDKIAGDLFEAM